METEIWKDIKDYEGLYQVSNWGRVKSLKFGRERVLKPGKNTDGYLQVCLCKDGKSNYLCVHRLVASTFLENPDNKQEVNHKSENKQDNRVENLEWVWHKDNCNYGTRNKRVSEKMTNGKLSKPVSQYSLDGTFINKFPSVMEVERQLGFNNGFISKCCLGRCKQAYGYKWNIFLK